MQRFSTPKGFTVTAADTAAHPFPARPAGKVYLSTPAANAGTVTVTDTDSGGLGGLVLGKGVGVTIPVVEIGPILNLESLSFQFSSAGDVLNYLVLS